MTSEHTKYLALTAAVLITLLAVTASWNLRSNPFGLYPASDGGKQLDPDKQADLFWHMRLHKPYRLEQVSATHLILGSSRSGRLPPDVMLSDSKRGYNAALPGGTLFELHRQLEHAHSIQAVEHLVLGLDYQMFLEHQPRHKTGFETSRLRTLDERWLHTLKRQWQTVEDGWASLLSRSALTASYRMQDPPQKDRRVFFDNGTWHTIPGDLAGSWVYALMAKEKYLQFSKQSQTTNVAPLREIIEFCQAHDIKLSLMFSPSHAHIMNAIELSGGWPKYLKYQRDVKNLVDSMQRAHQPIKLYGFELNRHYLFEKISPNYRWFLDGIHYTPEAGLQFMNCIQGNKASRCDADFRPVRLDQQEIEPYLSGVTTLMQAYRTERKKAFKRLEKQSKKLAAKN